MSKKQKWVALLSEWQCHLLSCQVTAKNQTFPDIFPLCTHTAQFHCMICTFRCKLHDVVQYCVNCTAQPEIYTFMKITLCSARENALQCNCKAGHGQVAGMNCKSSVGPLKAIITCVIINVIQEEPINVVFFSWDFVPMRGGVCPNPKLLAPQSGSFISTAERCS